MSGLDADGAAVREDHICNGSSSYEVHAPVLCELAL